MNGERLTYRHVQQVIRPSRAAVMFPREGGWMVGATQALQVLSRTWGGSSATLVPIAGDGTTDSVLWPLLRRFDPDVWAHLLPTRRGLELADPEAYERLLSSEAERLASQVEGGVDAAREMLRDDHILDTPLMNWRPSDEIVEVLRRETAPMPDLLDEFHVDAILSDGSPPHSMVDLADVAVPKFAVITNLDLAGAQPALALILATAFGTLTQRASDDLTAAGWAIASPPINVDLFDFLRLAWATGALRPQSHPFGVNETGCAWWFRGRVSPSQMPLHLVVGDEPEDYALAMLADRLWRNAIWVPTSLIDGDDEPARRARTSLYSAIQDRLGSYRDAGVVAVSTSLDEGEINGLLDGVASLGSSLRIAHGTPDQLAADVRYMLLADTPTGEIAEPFLGAELAGVMPTPIPAGVLRPDRDDFRVQWIVEVDDPDHRLPARSELSPIVSTGRGREFFRIRVGATGLAYESHSLGFVAAGTPLSGALARPRIRFPEASEVFATLAAAHGYEIRESPAGAFAREAVQRWGSREAFAAALRDPTRRDLLDVYLSKEKSGVAPGNYMSDRRFLSLDDAVVATKASAADMRAILDEYVRTRVLRRGLCLHCTRCRHFGFYGLHDLADVVTCARCRSAFPIVEPAWRGGGDEPAWYYDLDEVVFQAIRGNVHVPVAALEHLQADARSVLAMFESEVERNGQKFEVDLWAVVEGRIILGECTTSDRLERNDRDERRRLNRLRALAETVRADALLFASAGEWSDRTRTNVATVFGQHFEVMIRDHIGAPPSAALAS